MRKIRRHIRPFLMSAGLLWLHLLCGSRGLAYTLSAPQRAAYITLQHTDYFAVGGVGAAGTTSKSEAALRVLLAHPHCVPILQDLLKTARAEGQLYALLGLKLKAPSLFHQQLTAYLSRRETVAVMEGCQGSTEAVSWVAGKIQHGDYDQRLHPRTATPKAPHRQPARRT